MQDNYFFPCTDTSSNRLGLHLFNDSQYDSIDEPSLSCDLSLKLRGNIFEQDAERARDLSDFNLGQQKLIRKVGFRDCHVDFSINQDKPTFVNSYLVSMFKENDDKANASNEAQFDFKGKSIFQDMEGQSTNGQNSNSVSPNSDRDHQEGKDENTTIDLASTPKSHPKLPTNVILNLQSAENSTPVEKIYKTPNYKNKKRSALKYVTKHSTTDLSGHEELMAQKYGVKLSVRKDVVNKTLFRALKRFYTEKFLSVFTLDKKESSTSYLDKIRLFCSQIFTCQIEQMQLWNITYEEMEKFISIVVSPNHIKNVLKEKTDLVLYKDYYSCLYQYSHKKLANMLSRPVCGYLFTNFINSEDFITFIRSCNTMGQNVDVYVKAGDEFVSNIRKSRKYITNDEVCCFPTMI